MATDITEKPKEDDSTEHTLNRKEVIHLGFQNKTKGEAAFNAISYIGVGYLGVTAFSVFTTWLMSDKIPGIGTLIEKGAQKIGLSKTIATIATLFAGGTLATVLPVKWLEDRKPKAVKKLDYMLYNEDQFYNDPKIQAAHKELDELPKQTWLSVFGSRVVAFAATLGVFFAMGGKDSPFAKRFGTSLDEISIKAGRRIDGFFGKGHPDVGKAIKRAETLSADLVSRAKDEVSGKNIGDRIPSRVYSYLALDAIYTLITSMTLWVSTRIFGAMVGKVSPQDESPVTLAAKKKESELAPFISKSQAQEPQQDAATPPTKITAPVHLERVAEPHHNAELTA